MYNAALYVLTVLIWGSTWLAIKYQLGVVSPELSIAYRFGLAAFILLIYSLLRRLPLRYGLKSHGFFALQGFLLFSLNYILVYVAEGYLTSGLVAIIFSLIIVLNVIFGAVFLRNPIRTRVLFGAAIGLAGLSFVFWGELSSFSLTSQKAFGMILALVSTISASLGNVVSARNQRHGLPVIQTNAYGMLYGAVFMLVFAIFRSAQLEFDTSAGYILSLFYLAIFGSVIAFGSYLTLIGKIGLDRAAYVTVLFPVIALLLSTFFEDLEWGTPQLVGVILILLGNAVVVTKKWDIGWMKRSKQDTLPNK
ncbi:MAG: EamA family transporter [Chloroflexota bacterium]|nr:MAG: EamA family transporter [Chloroflexota bacterium]